jgi:hypothetical protein
MARRNAAQAWQCCCPLITASKWMNANSWNRSRAVCYVGHGMPCPDRPSSFTVRLDPSGHPLGGATVASSGEACFGAKRSPSG